MVKNLPANAGDIGDEGLIPGSGRSSAGGNSNPVQYFYMENTINRGAWKIPMGLGYLPGVAKSQT